MTWPAPEHVPLVSFLAGAFATFLGMCAWRLVRLAIDIRVTRERARKIELASPHDALAKTAWDRVSACRKRLRFNPSPNPEWVGPLVKEVPVLVREIAVVYYPDHPDPIQAPRLSEFARAVQFVATDIAEVLQSRRMGRLIDISAGKTVQAVRTGHRVWKHPRLKLARGIFQPAYKVGKPLWQIIRFKSPITWISIAASNAAVRTIQPAIINIIARRAIDLYSGKLAESISLPSPGRIPGETETPPGQIAQAAGAAGAAPTDPKETGRIKRAVAKVRSWRRKKS